MPTTTKSRQVPILLYHSVSDRAAPAFRKFAVSTRLFAEHMDCLDREGYQPLTVSAFRRVASQDLDAFPERPVVLTFDDGFLDFYTDAFPILSQHGFVATLYLATAFMGNTSRWLSHEGEGQREMLSWSQVRELSLNGIECGAHTHNHPQMDILGPLGTQHEIVTSKNELEQQLGFPVRSFAYPYGYYTLATMRSVKSAGFSSACAVGYSMSSTEENPFALSRLLVTANTTVQDLTALLLDGGPTARRAYLRARTTVWQVLRRTSVALRRGNHRGRSYL